MDQEPPRKKSHVKELSNTPLAIVIQDPALDVETCTTIYEMSRKRMNEFLMVKFNEELRSLAPMKQFEALLTRDPIIVELHRSRHVVCGGITETISLSGSKLGLRIGLHMRIRSSGPRLEFVAGRCMGKCVGEEHDEEAFRVTWKDGIVTGRLDHLPNTSLLYLSQALMHDECQKLIQKFFKEVK